MQFQQFSQFLEQIEGVTARLAITEILAQLFRHLDRDELPVALYLLQGRLVPAYESLEFQLSAKMVIRALARWQLERAQSISITNPSGAQQDEAIDLFGERVTTDPVVALTNRYQQLGDLGRLAVAVAEENQSTHASSTLTVLEVYQRLQSIAAVAGEGSQEEKLHQLATLLPELDSVSVKFVVRVILGQLRLGFATMTLLDALSWTRHGDKRDSKQLELAYQKKADIGKLATTYLHGNNQNIEQLVAAYEVEVGVPLVPALCQRLETADEVIAKMDEVIVEPKFDGVRIQIHFQRGRGVRTFTRSLEENSHQFPELKQLDNWLTVENCILDGEAIAYDPHTGQLKPFQETITRKRKHDVASQAAKLPLKFFIFDVLFKDGASLLSEKLQDRKDLLKNVFNKNESIMPTPYIVATEAEMIRSYHRQQLGAGLEGVVMKQVSSVYQSGRKGWSWVKMKEAEGSTGKLMDTLDCVVLGYYFGRGKRTQFGLGAFLVGVIDSGSSPIDQPLTLKTIAKIGTGLSDDQFRELKQRANALAVSEPPQVSQVPKALAPDVWLQPGLVVEVAADELTRSPLHSAGLALRFPRLVRFRDDKTWHDATTLSEVETLSRQALG